MNIGNVEKKGSISLRNRFSVLDEQSAEDPEVAPEFDGDRLKDPVARGRASKTWAERLVGNFERVTPKKVHVNNVDSKQSIVITVDSGAAENVMPDYMALKFKLRQ